MIEEDNFDEIFQNGFISRSISMGQLSEKLKVKRF